MRPDGFAKRCARDREGTREHAKTPPIDNDTTIVMRDNEKTVVDDVLGSLATICDVNVAPACNDTRFAMQYHEKTADGNIFNSHAAICDADGVVDESGLRPSLATGIAGNEAERAGFQRMAVADVGVEMASAHLTDKISTFCRWGVVVCVHLGRRFLEPLAQRFGRYGIGTCSETWLQKMYQNCCSGDVYDHVGFGIGSAQAIG